MLSYEEFKEELIKQTKENMPQRYRDAEVEIIRVPKNNDRMFEGISDRRTKAVVLCFIVWMPIWIICIMNRWKRQFHFI